MGRQQALTAPYPFATVQPNVGVVDVPDERLVKLRDAMFPTAENNEQKTENNDQNKFPRPPLVFSAITFVDIAGLVKGAAEGQGLGNQFLSHIRDVDVIVHVLRDFEDPDVPRHQDSKNPEYDAEIVKTELGLKDLEVEERAKNSNKETPASKLRESPSRLADKPVIYAVNVGEEKLSDQIAKRSNLAIWQGRTLIYFCAKLEEEISKLPQNEQKEFIKMYGLKTSGLDRIIAECYSLLGLISFFTAPASAKAPAGQAGKWEVRAWPVRRDSLAPQAAGVIHSDFERLFIRAVIIGWEKMIAAGSWQGAKEKGWIKTEGKDYIIQDGDVCNFLVGK